MPGHKRNTSLLGNELPYKTDLTEIPGFDNLQNPEGILKQTAELAASLYGSGRAFLSVNGSTGALLAAVRACTKPHDKIIMARNCHKSVYNAAEINLLRPVYIYPPVDTETGITGSVQPVQLRDKLKDNSDAKLVILTSPTYEGVLSDVRQLAKAAHEHGVPVLVDAAHGAHLGFSDYFGESAVQAGADLAVMSLHKTLPALTQCALLHSQGNRVKEYELQNAVNIYQTSSPSYVLLSSIDACLRLIETEGRILYEAYVQRLRTFYETIKIMKRLHLFVLNDEDNSVFYNSDPGKLVILTHNANINGPELAGLLRTKYKIEIEMAAPEYIIAMTSICDSDESISRLAESLLDIDSGLSNNVIPKTYKSCQIPKAAAATYELSGAEGEQVSTKNAVGRVSLEYIWVYPPGVPLIVPGEVIPESFVEHINYMDNLILHSSRGGFPRSIYCEK